MLTKFILESVAVSRPREGCEKAKKLVCFIKLFFSSQYFHSITVYDGMKVIR